MESQECIPFMCPGTVFHFKLQLHCCQFGESSCTCKRTKILLNDVNQRWSLVHLLHGYFSEHVLSSGTSPGIEGEDARWSLPTQGLLYVVRFFKGCSKVPRPAPHTGPAWARKHLPKGLETDTLVIWNHLEMSNHRRVRECKWSYGLTGLFFPFLSRSAFMNKRMH